jgi:prepilin-type N-terminal cleavage/methylation domain-containing protein
MTQPPRRHGFTLVEMLTVIVIIGILAAFTVGGVIAARRAVIRGIVVADMRQIEMAVQKYKTEVGEFPPDFAFCDETSVRGDAARARVLNHLRKRFPRLKVTNWADFTTAVSATAGPGANQLNPSTALVFWLGGVIIEGKPKGFSEDPANPFKVGEPRTTPYLDFDPARIPPGSAQYLQPRIQPVSPYVYFRAVKNNASGNFEYGDATDSDVFEPFSFGSGANVCVPYLEDAYDVAPTSQVNPIDPDKRARLWRSPETYQIIAAGLDGVFSTDTPSPVTPPTLPNPAPFRFSKVGQNFSDGDYDNLASFAEGDLQREL